MSEQRAHIPDHGEQEPWENLCVELRQVEGGWEKVPCKCAELRLAFEAGAAMERERLVGDEQVTRAARVRWEQDYLPDELERTWDSIGQDVRDYYCARVRVMLGALVQGDTP